MASKAMKTWGLPIEMLDPNTLIPYAQNNKKHTEEEIATLAKIIAEFDFDQPIVVDENKIILKGHKRRLAALQLGLKEIPVAIRTGLTEAQKRAIRIADNKVAESEWDHEMLTLELDYLSEQDFDMSLTGFLDEEIDFYLSDEEKTEYQPGQIFGLQSSEIPQDNKDIDEEKLTQTKHKCPSCGHQW